MKQLLTVIALIAITLFGCNKQASNKLATMDGFEFTAKYKIRLPYLDYGDEPAVGRSNGNSKAKPKADEVALTVTVDLALSHVAGTLYHSTTSVNAEWAAFQNLTDTVAYCPQNWSNVAAPSGMDCNVVVSGITLRTFTSDKGTSGTAYDIHLSNPVTTL